MTDKPTDNEIVKVLEGMIQFANTVDRSVLDMVDVKTLKNILDLINRLKTKNSNLSSDLTSLQNDLTSAKAAIEALISGQETLQKHIATLQAENTELLGKIEGLEANRAELLENIEQLESVITQIKAEAYKEFAKKFKERFIKEKICKCYIVIDDDIDNILKELVGEDDAR